MPRYTAPLIGTGWRIGRMVLNEGCCLHARGRGRALSAAPKEQPPRKLSGKRTAGARALWKAAGAIEVDPLTEGVSPLSPYPPPQAREGRRSRVNLSGSATEGAPIGRFGVRSVGGAQVSSTATLAATPA